jgi:hypothetical protein
MAEYTVNLGMGKRFKIKTARDVSQDELGGIIDRHLMKPQDFTTSLPTDAAPEKAGPQFVTDEVVSEGARPEMPPVLQQTPEQLQTGREAYVKKMQQAPQSFTQEPMPKDIATPAIPEIAKLTNLNPLNPEGIIGRQPISTGLQGLMKTHDEFLNDIRGLDSPYDDERAAAMERVARGFITGRYGLKAANALAGAGLGAAMSGTLGGLGFNLGTQALNEVSPEAGKVAEVAQAPLQSLLEKWKPGSTQNTSAGELAKLGDTALNLAVLHGLGKMAPKLLPEEAGALKFTPDRMNRLVPPEFAGKDPSNMAQRFAEERMTPEMAAKVREKGMLLDAAVAERRLGGATPLEVADQAKVPEYYKEALKHFAEQPQMEPVPMSPFQRFLFEDKPYGISKEMRLPINFIPPLQTSKIVSKMTKGEETPFVWSPEFGLNVGERGTTHIESFGKSSAELTKKGGIVGRFDDGGVVGLWHDSNEVPEAKLRALLTDLRADKHVPNNGVAFFQDGNGVRVRQAIEEGADRLNTMAVPGVDAKTLKKAVRLAKELTLANRGATIDPRTGESVKLGPDESFVSIWPERTKPDAKLTQGDIADYIDNNGDLLKQPDHHVGTWHDESGKLVLDVVTKMPTEEAKRLGAENFQKAIFGREGEAEQKEIPTGGTGEAPAGWKHPVEEYSRLQTWKESQLPPEEQAKLQELRQARKEQTIWQQDFGEQDNQIEAQKRAVEYMRDKLKYDPLLESEDVEARARRLVEVMQPDLERVYGEFEKWKAKGGTQEDWYAGLAEMKKRMAKYYPWMNDPVKQKLFSAVTNIFANGAPPNEEALNGIAAMERYIKDGKFVPPEKGMTEFIGNVRADTWAAHVEELQKLIDLKGEKGAMDWLEQKHPIKEMNEIKNKIRSPRARRDKFGNLMQPSDKPKMLPSEYGEGKPIEGAYIFGPKMGAYYLNKEGVTGPIALDSWMNIAAMISRVMTQIDTGIDRITKQPYEELHKQNSVRERAAFYEAIRRMAKDMNTTPHDVQAMLWRFVIRPFFERHGQRMREGGSHGQVAKWLDESGWLLRRTGEQGASLGEGKEITVSRGISEASQYIPESLRIKPEEGREGKGGYPESWDEFGLSPEDDSIMMSLVPGLPDPTINPKEAKEMFDKYAGSINVQRMNISDEEKKKLHEDYAKMAPELEKLLGTKLTQEQVRQAAENSDKWENVLPFDAQLKVAAGVLKLRQIVAEGAKTGKLTRDYYENFVRLQSIAKFAGRLLSHFNINADPALERVRRGEIVPGRQALMEHVLEKLQESGADMERVITEGEKVDWTNTQQVTKFYREFVKPSAWELLTEFRYINMLSSPLTHSVNFATNLGMASGLAPLTKVASAAVAAPLRVAGLEGKSAEHYFAEAPAYMRGATKSFPQAIKAAADVMMNRSPIEKMDISMLEHLPSAGVANKRYLVPLAKFNQTFAFVSRAIEASDQFWQKIAGGGELEAGIVKTQKAGRDPLKEMATLNTNAVKAAQKWLFRDATDPKNLEGQGAVLSAIDAASNQVLRLRKLATSDATGERIIGKTAQYFIPFVVTPMNILKRGIEYSPAGFATMWKSADKVEAFTKAMIGTSIFAGASALVANTESTFDAPRGESDKADFYASGKRPFSILLGDRWVQYNKLGPLGYPFALAAAWKKYQDDPAYQGKDMEKRVSAGVEAIAKFFGSQSYMQGLENLSAVAQGNVGSMVQSSAGVVRQYVPLAAMLQWVNMILDPKQRVPTNMIERVTMSIPGLSQSLPVRMTPLGQESKREPATTNLGNINPLTMSSQPNDPIQRQVNKYNLKIGVPSRKVFGSDITEQQYQEYIKKVGKLVYDNIGGFFNDPDFPKATQEQRQTAVDKLVHKARNVVKHEMFPDLEQKMYEAKEAQ